MHFRTHLTRSSFILLPATHRQTRDYALRFLTHFVGDAHQPLHLTGRARGGNDIWVHFEVGTPGFFALHADRLTLNSCTDGSFVTYRAAQLVRACITHMSLIFPSTLTNRVLLLVLAFGRAALCLG